MKYFNEKMLTLITYLINYLLNENSQTICNLDEKDFDEKFQIYKSLCNIRPPNSISKKYLEEEKNFFQEYNKIRNIQNNNQIKTISQIYPMIDNKYKNILALWKGDITTLEIDAIVNAANSNGLGCFQPSHVCIDNIIHTYAGVSLRLECKEKMKKIKYLEVGKAFITSGHNLPAKYVIHTVGPMIDITVTEYNKKELENCYLNSLKLANENNIKSIAFPCISTGIFRFPKDLASEIAIKAVIKFLDNYENNFEKIIFNVYSDIDFEIYLKNIKSNYIEDYDNNL